MEVATLGGVFGCVFKPASPMRGPSPSSHGMAANVFIEMSKSVRHGAEWHASNVEKLVAKIH
jgi:hypothetical protein